ncbi:enoyl-CoA hydratase/isomerase family protein [Rhizobium sp.]
MPEPIISELDDGVLTVTLNRPEKLNALTPPMAYRLLDMLKAAARDPAVGCLVLKGAGRAFCAGGDVSQFAAVDKDDPVAARSSNHPAWAEAELSADRLRERAETAVLLHTMPKPTIAAVRGPAMGAGLSLMAACDIRIACADAMFGTAYAKVGLSGDYGASYFLSQLVGASMARDMFFLNRCLDAREAERFGLVNRVVEDDVLESEAMAIARQLAEGPPVAWRYIKQNLVAAESESLRDVLDFECRNMIRTMNTADAKGAIEAFLSKQPVTFAGY